MKARHWAPGLSPQSDTNLLQNAFPSLYESVFPSIVLVLCTVMYKITYFDDQGLGPLTYTLKKMRRYVCVSHMTLPANVAAAFEFSSQITLNFATLKYCAE